LKLLGHIPTSGKARCDIIKIEDNFMEVSIMSFKKLIGMAGMVALTVLLSACNLGATPAPTQDTGLIYTQAAQLVGTQFAMQQTQTALAIPPTALRSPTAPALPTFPAATPFGASTPFGGSTPFGTSTPFGGSTPFGAATLPGGFLPTPTIMVFATPAGPQCDAAILIADVTIPDGTEIKPGLDFEKVWRIQNTGTCTWDDGYAFVYGGGSLDGYNLYFDKTEKFVAPGATADLKVNLTASLKPNTYQECWSMMNDRGQYFLYSPVACVKIVVK
jgi:hypothetical protein